MEFSGETKETKNKPQIPTRIAAASATATKKTQRQHNTVKTILYVRKKILIQIVLCS